MQKLPEAELKKALRELPTWHLRDGSITKEWRFKDFAAAMTFVNRVAGIAENAGHHPDIDIRYSTVTLALITHDANGITANDVAMCRRLDQDLSNLEETSPR